MWYAAGVAWVLALAGLFCCVALAAMAPRSAEARGSASSRTGDFVRNWVAIVALAATTTLAVFPSHIFNPLILRDLLDRLITRDGGQDLLATAIVSGKLYLGVLLLKLGLPFGVLTLAALGWVAVKAARDRACLLLTAVLVYYASLLAILPLQQPFWLMSVYPVILLALSAMVVRGLHAENRRALRWSTTTGVVIAVLWLAAGLTQVYPTFGYYGYETTGNRWLGAESRGYRRLIVITNDGSTQALDWLEHNAPAGARVVSYLNDLHLIRHLHEARQPSFELIEALREPDSVRLSSHLASAEFAVVRAVNEDDGPPPQSNPEFVRQFGAEPVHEIVRGRGIYRMPVIGIYRRATP
jgi:hypothetical protein